MLTCDRDQLREQNELSDEMANAMTSATLGNALDEQDLEDELDQMQQEKLDEDMLKTGTVPVLQSPPSQERKCREQATSKAAPLTLCSRLEQEAGRGRGRRGSGTRQAPSRDGHVSWVCSYCRQLCFTGRVYYSKSLALALFLSTCLTGGAEVSRREKVQRMDVSKAAINDCLYHLC